MSTPTHRWSRYGGVLIAILGFVITRQFVAQTVQPGSTLSFVVLSLLPLVVGLGVTVYGVILIVGRFSSLYVRTVTVWCVLGTGSVATLVALTQLTAVISGGTVDPLASSHLLVANLLLGGAVGGILIGDRSAANERKRRAIQRTANRATLVNRLLRHDVINAAAIVDGHAALLEAEPGRSESIEAVDAAADRIIDTIEDVGHIAPPNRDGNLTTLELKPLLSAVIEDCRESYPDRSIRLGELPTDLTVAADEGVGLIFRELLINALEYGSDGEVTIRVEPTPRTVAISIVDGGEGLPDRQQALLESGQFPEYDDPTSGFGLQLVSLLVDRYGGRITTTGDSMPDEPHRITVWLPRHTQTESVLDRVGVRLPTVARAVGAGLFAGIVMGGFYQATTGTMPVIGALYGLSHVGIGWVTHLFHSIIFALVFATGCTAVDIERYVSTLPQAVAVGLVWGTVLWFVAAGFVMPAWLLAVGQPATLPTLELNGLLAHGLWGVTLGGSYILLGRYNLGERLSKQYDFDEKLLEH